MATWSYDPTQYEEQDFVLIPEGDHRVRIEEVSEREFRSGNSGYEIVLAASGYNSRIWYYLVLNPDDVKATNQRIGAMFDSFGITDTDMSHYKAWEGKVGAAKIRHEEYNGDKQAKIRYFIRRSKQDSLPPWKGDAAETPAAAPAVMAELPDDDDLPF